MVREAWRMGDDLLGLHFFPCVYHKAYIYDLHDAFPEHGRPDSTWIELY